MIDLQTNISDQKLAQVYVALAMMRKVAEENTDQTETIRSILSLINVASSIIENVLVSSPWDHVHVNPVESEIELLM